MKAKVQRRRLLIVLPAIILLVATVFMVLTKITYDQEFPRYDTPEFNGYLTYADIDGYSRSTVQFMSGKHTLTGYIYGAVNHKGLVVISHGLGGGAESHLAETLYFVDRGWRVFAFDNTGTRQSEGASTVGLAQSVIDLDAALNFISQDSTLNHLPLMLYGHSWGGYAVTAILHREYDINAAVSIAGYNAPIGLLMEYISSGAGPLAHIIYPFAWAYQRMLFGAAAALTAVDGINGSNTPVMIIHGDQDAMISYSGASIIAQRAKITNPHVKYRTSSKPGHNGHNNLFRSEAAAGYIEAINVEYKQLYDSYEGQIPDAVNRAFYAGVDKFRTSELDPEFMAEINSFYEQKLVTQ